MRKEGRALGDAWESLGAVKLVFNNDYTVSVYKDGQYLYKVGSLRICHYACVVAPMQKLVIPVSWESDGIAMGVAPFRYSKNEVGYGLTYVYGTQTVAMPFYYKYNLTGAYPYRLEVKIDTAEREITRNSLFIYINVTYSGYLKLYLGDKLEAYDALYGWTIRVDYAPPSEGGSVGEPSGTCVPQIKKIPKGLKHGNLQKSENGYSVEVVRKYEVREFGCGVDRKYT